MMTDGGGAPGGRPPSQDSALRRQMLDLLIFCAEHGKVANGTTGALDLLESYDFHVRAVAPPSPAGAPPHSEKALQVLARLVDYFAYEITDNYGSQRCLFCRAVPDEVVTEHRETAVGPCPWGEAEKLLEGRSDVVDLVEWNNQLQGKLAWALRAARPPEAGLTPE